jgi:hypothetical protein
MKLKRQSRLLPIQTASDRTCQRLVEEVIDAGTETGDEVDWVAEEVSTA